MHPVQMTQGPLITQHAFHLVPRRAVQLLTGLAKLMLCRGTGAEMAIRATPRQCRRDLPNHPFGLERVVEKPLGLPPGPSGLTRNAAGIAPTLLVLPNFGTRLTCHLQLTLDVLPLVMQHALHLALRMKHVEPHRDRWA